MTEDKDEKKRWYVLQAFSGYEARVAATLKEFIKQHNMHDEFGEILIPTEEVVENVGGKRRKSERKFFPGYVLINMNMTEEAWHLVKSIPRVLGFVGGSSDKPLPITEKEANTILNRIQQTGDKPRPKTIFNPGEEIRIINGPFADFNAIVEEIDFEKNRVKVAVSIFGRETPVELEFSQIEKII